MATFGWSEAHICEEITGASGWAYFAWSVMNRASFFGSSVEMASPGYVAQEIQRLKKIQ